MTVPSRSEHSAAEEIGVVMRQNRAARGGDVRTAFQAATDREAEDIAAREVAIQEVDRQGASIAQLEPAAALGRIEHWNAYIAGVNAGAGALGEGKPARAGEAQSRAPA